MASNERTPPYAAEKSLNGHAKAYREVVKDGVTYRVPEVDVMQVARDAFGDLDEFWEGRRQRWKDEVEGEDDAGESP